MDSSKTILESLYASTRWHRERSEVQRAFDSVVIAKLEKGIPLETAMREAACEYPTSNSLTDGMTVSDLREYFRQVRRLDLEVRMAELMEARIRRT